LLFGEAARKMQKEFRTIPPPSFVSLAQDGSPLLTKIGNPEHFVLEFRSKTWDNFKFDRQAILNLDSLRVTTRKNGLS
jgi:hypothetical protein